VGRNPDDVKAPSRRQIAITWLLLGALLAVQRWTDRRTETHDRQ